MVHPDFDRNASI